MRSAWQRIVYSIVVPVGLVLIWLVLGVTIYCDLTRGAAFGFPPWAEFICVGVVLICPCFLFVQYRLAARFRRLGRGPFFHIEGYISPDAIHLWSDGRVTVLPWSVFAARRWNNVVVLLFFNKPSDSGQVFARSMFETEADWQAFRALVEEKLPPR